jgi:phosphohistidine phosphatase
MRRLILFRHGKAEMAAATGGDRERALAERGRADSSRTAQWLLACGFVPDVVLVSPALRTQTTWDCVRPYFPNAKVEVRAPLYLAGTETILEVLEAAPAGADTVMVVGHNPGLQELGVHLAETGLAPETQINRIEDGFPTAAVAVFSMDLPEGATLEALYEPARQAGLAPRWVYARGAAGARS